MDKQERIVCAAIEFTVEDSFIATQQDKYVLCGVGYEEIKDLNNSVLGREVLHAHNGFVTDRNRFVDPKEAEVIAGLAGQIWTDSGKHNLSALQFKKSLCEMKNRQHDRIVLRFPSNEGYYFIYHTIGCGLKPEDLY